MTNTRKVRQARGLALAGVAVWIVLAVWYDRYSWSIAVASLFFVWRGFAPPSAPD